MENKHTIIYDFDHTLIADFFRGLKRQGPESDEITKLALHFINDLPDNPSIADIGCGTGGQTITLAQSTNGKIKAVDLMPEFVESLKENIKQLGLDKKIFPSLESMTDLSFEEAEFDLIWAEGSIYNIGYQKGLKEWRKYLKTNGYIAVSEVSWFTDSRPQKISDYWESNYPEIDTIPNKVKQMQQAAYTPVAHFIFPEICWWNYFNPILNNIEPFLQKHNYSEGAKDLVDHLTEEIALYRKYKLYYGYVFYIGQKSDLVNGKDYIDTENIRIRAETEKDLSGIYDLIQTAFKTAKVKDGDEQDFAVKLRNSDRYIPELALVAEYNNKLIGQIMLTKTYLTTESNKEEYLLLAPISVLIEYRDQGIGSKLIHESLDKARKSGYKAVFLCGDPAYYQRFGFRPTCEFGIKPALDIPAQYVMAYELETNALKDRSGIVECC